jgi:uncharacterized protein (TIGR02145 family)
MSKFLLLKIVLVLGFANLSQAQTIKSIHRTDLPTLHVPTHLIEKVETVLENNVRKLKITQTSGNVIEIQTQTIDSITHQQGQAVDPTQLGELRTASAIGVVRDEQGNAVPMALVKSAFSLHQTTTDSNGVFFLNNFIVYDKLGFITIEKPGYFKGSRSFLPLQSGASRLEIQLLHRTLSGTFNSTSGGQITAGSLQINFPSNGIVQANGQPYTGTVNVFSRALDPSSQAMFDQMPGELLGGMNDSLRILQSFGMAAVELFGNNNEPLQLASGQNATLRFTIPAGLMNEAPETIDWWSFDEEAGYWKHEGIAQKQGNEYIGQASHFSWWNCDVPENFVELVGEVFDFNNVPISDALVNVDTESLGTGRVYTNQQGIFSGRVPRNQVINISFSIICIESNDWVFVFDEDLQIFEEDININISGLLSDRFPITGAVLDCNSQPVQFGYVKLNSQVFLTNNGQFTIQVCNQAPYVLTGVDAGDPQSLKESLPLTVQVTAQGGNAGNLIACNEIVGDLIDIDGNVYQTVQIGDQLWMAENLKTSRFANGDPIPLVMENTAWAQLSTPAWCNYENNSAYDAIYGKLYNWFTVSDPRNVCPDGWHVPSVDEWNVLREFLGGQAVAGGKMKTTSGWELPNTGATNESGFSALPAGYRWFNDGSFTNLTFFAGWWTSTEFDIENAFYRFITHTSSALSGNYTFGKRRGFSIRCIRD